MISIFSSRFYQANKSCRSVNFVGTFWPQEFFFNVLPGVSHGSNWSKYVGKSWTYRIYNDGSNFKIRPHGSHLVSFEVETVTKLKIFRQKSLQKILVGFDFDFFQNFNFQNLPISGGEIFTKKKGPHNRMLRCEGPFFILICSFCTKQLSELFSVIPTAGTKMSFVSYRQKFPCRAVNMSRNFCH